MPEKSASADNLVSDQVVSVNIYDHEEEEEEYPYIKQYIHDNNITITSLLSVSLTTTTTANTTNNTNKSKVISSNRSKIIKSYTEEDNDAMNIEGGGHNSDPFNADEEGEEEDDGGEWFSAVPSTTTTTTTTTTRGSGTGKGSTGKGSIGVPVWEDEDTVGDITTAAHTTGSGGVYTDTFGIAGGDKKTIVRPYTSKLTLSDGAQIDVIDVDAVIANITQTEKVTSKAYNTIDNTTTNTTINDTTTTSGVVIVQSKGKGKGKDKPVPIVSKSDNESKKLNKTAGKRKASMVEV